ncbi:MAG: endolytic transglycosylase MltG [Deltaproteobacteria bacterium]|nr:endolytic transglycosylase MltG [Deltaproteobacteria bacterium]
MKAKRIALILGIVVVVGGLLGAGALWLRLRAGAQGARGPAAAPELVFEVKKGATGKALGAELHAQGLIESPLYWRVYLREHPGFSPKAGKHALSPRMTIPEIGKALEAAPISEDEPFVMIEGWRLRDTDEALAAKGWIKPGAYLAAAKDVKRFKAPFPLPARGLEGYLYPETYRVSLEGGFKPEALIERQLGTFVERFYQPHNDELKKTGRSLDEIVIMASMLEREEPVPKQRMTVAGILWKRIDKGFALGVDATSRYELADWNNRTEFLKKLRDKSDPYNTRERVGLPPSPIGAPTVDSLTAAMRPEKNEFLYYLHDSNKVLHPSRNAAEHEALRDKYNVH